MYAKARRRVSKGFTKVGALILVFALVFCQFAYSVNAAVQDPATDYVALGDSISFGIGASQPDNGYVNSFYNFLRVLPGNEGMVLKNLSVSGLNTTMLKNILANNDTQLALAKAKVVTVSIGGNNLLGPIIAKIQKYAGTGIDDPNLKQKILAIFADKDKFNLYTSIITSELNAGVQKFEQDWPEITSNIKTLAPSADIYAMTVYNPFAKGDIFYNMVDPFIQRINKTINTPNAGYKVADVYTAFNNDTSGLPLTKMDSFDPHPTDKGHEIIFNAHLDAYNSQQPSPTPTVTTTPVVTTAPTVEIATATPLPYSFNGAGLTGLYFNDRESTDLKLIRLDPTIDLYGYGELPSPSIGKNPFSICWAGQIQPKYSETYTLYTDSDCCVNLWVDDQVLIDDFDCTKHTTGHNSATITFEAGKKYNIVLGYADSDYFANMRLSWSSASQAKEVVPKECLYQMELKDTAYLLVGLAANVETQKSINQAASIVSQLPAGTEKSELAEELNTVQMNIYEAAAELVDEAENNISQLNYDNAVKLVNTLPQGLIKSALSGRLQLVKNAIDAQFKGTGLLCELFKGTELNNLGAAWVDRVFTLDWGSDLPTFIGNDEGISARWSGQVQPRYSDTYTFYLTAVGGQRLTVNGQLIIDSWQHGNGMVSGQIALEAGRKYDIKVEYFEETGSPSLYMEWESQNQNRDIVNKESLYPEDITPDATDLVNTAEMLITQESVNYALKALDFVADEAVKNSLTIRLSAVQYILNSNAALMVQKAELDKTQASVNEAMDMVSALNDGELKSALLERLNAVQDIINASVSALVEKAETDKTQASVNEAINAVNTLNDGELKSALLERLNAVQDSINSNAAALVEKAEAIKTQSAVAEAMHSVEQLNAGAFKDGLIARLNAVQDIILANATALVAKAEADKTQISVNEATEAVNELIADAVKDELLARLSAIQVIVNVNATVLVEKAETEKTQASVNAATDAVNELNAGPVKEELLNRLSAVQDIINTMVTVLVEKAENDKTKQSFIEAKNAVNSLISSDIKTALEARLDALEPIVFKTIGNVDQPKDNTLITGVYKFSGWLLDISGVKKIEVLADDVVIGEAVYGISRPDVFNLYPEYENSNAGFQYDFDSSLLSEGTHIIKFRETGNNGLQKILQAKKIIVSRLPVRGWLDVPDSYTFASNSAISGWILDSSGVSKIEVLVDDVVVGEADYGLARPDILGAYPDYNNANAGFKYNLDVSKLSDGKHVVKIRETGLNGGKTVLQSKAVFVKVPAIGYIDFPTNMAVLSGQINVHGWFLDRSGVSKVEILIDDAVVGEAAYGDSRPDVMNVYPLYNNSNAGYQYMLDTTLLTEGQHSIKVRETGNSGESITLNAKDFIVTRLPIRAYLDLPLGTVSGTTKVSGWILDGSGVSKVEILVDGVVVGEAVYGDTRADVAAKYPDYNNANAGFHYSLDTTAFADGEHVVNIREIGGNGGKTVLPPRKITVANSIG